jgi:uncharacterized protein (TIGR03435 family)
VDAESIATGRADQSERPGNFRRCARQLGLKLQSSRGPVDVVVIDHVEHPTED